LSKTTESLNEEERRFVNHPYTHVDFLIYNRVDRQPVLVVEVDGYAFHDAKPEQLKRDNLKDSILQQYRIPIIRFKTIESREEERLRIKLQEVVG